MLLFILQMTLNYSERPSSTSPLQSLIIKGTSSLRWQVIQRKSWKDRLKYCIVFNTKSSISLTLPFYARNFLEKVEQHLLVLQIITLCSFVSPKSPWLRSRKEQVHFKIKVYHFSRISQPGLLKSCYATILLKTKQFVLNTTKQSDFCHYLCWLVLLPCPEVSSCIQIQQCMSSF